MIKQPIIRSVKVSKRMPSNSSNTSSTDSGYQVLGANAAKKFIDAYDNGHNVSNIKDALTELLREQGDDNFYSSNAYPQLLQRFDSMLSSAAEAKEAGNATILLIQYLIQSSKDNEKIRVCIRDEYGFLLHLSSLFNPNRNNDANLILECIELISRGLLISWKAPYIQGLVNKCFTYILNEQMESREYDCVLQLLINLCRKNSSCIMIIRLNKKYHEVWARLRTMPNDLEILVTHLLCLLEPTIPSSNFLSGYEMFSQGIESVLRTWKNSRQDDIDEEELSKQLMTLGQLMETILDRMKPIYESIAAEEECSSSQKSDLSAEHYKVITDTKAILMEKLTSIHNFVKTNFIWSGSVINELLGLMLILFPVYTRRILTMDFYKITFEIIDKIVTRTKNDVKAFTTCLKVFHYLAKHLSVMDSPRKNDLGSHLCQTLQRIELLVENSPEAVERNITCLQLMSCLAELHETSDLVLKKLDVDILEGLLDIMSREDDSLHAQIQLSRSVCVVELLNLLSQYSKLPEIINLIMKSISSSTTYAHISNCIINGSEDIVERALHITASVGFYGKRTSVGVAKALMIKRDRPLCLKDPPPIISQPLGTNSFVGATHLSETLRSIGDLVEMDSVPESSGMMNDVFAWYRLNKEMHEHEIHNLNNHVYQLNKTISHLKYLIEKQTEFVSRRLACKDENELQIIQLQHKLEKTKKEMEAITTRTSTEIERLKTSLRIKTEAHRDASEKLKSLEAEFQELSVQSKEALKERASLTEKVKSLKASNKELTNESSLMRKDLSESKQRLSKLESEVKKKEEDRLALAAQLEEKTKVLETIQGLMGVRNYK